MEPVNFNNAKPVSNVEKKGESAEIKKADQLGKKTLHTESKKSVSQIQGVISRKKLRASSKEASLSASHVEKVKINLSTKLKNLDPPSIEERKNNASSQLNSPVSAGKEKLLKSIIKDPENTASEILDSDRLIIGEKIIPRSQFYTKDKELMSEKSLYRFISDSIEAYVKEAYTNEEIYFDTDEIINSARQEFANEIPLKYPNTISYPWANAGKINETKFDFETDAISKNSDIFVVSKTVKKIFKNLDNPQEKPRLIIYESHVKHHLKTGDVELIYTLYADGKKETWDPAKNAEVQVIALLLKNSTFRTFNDYADVLKNDPQWKNKVNEEIKMLTKEQKETLADLDLSNFNDYDRQVFREILQMVRNEGIENDNLESNIQKLFTKIINVEEKEPYFKYLGGGAVNKVYSVDDGTNQGVFKPDPSEIDLVTQIKEKNFGTAKASGIPEGDDAHLTARSVASFALDKLLYGDDNPIGVKTEYVIVNGKRGILMETAKGGSPEPPIMVTEELNLTFLKKMNAAHLLENGKLVPDGENQLKKLLGVEEIIHQDNKIFVTIPEFHIKKSIEVKIDESSFEYKHIELFISNKKVLSPNEANFIRSQLPNFKKIRISRRTDNKLEIFVTKAHTPIKLETPVTVEGLLKMQVFDWISGQVDRHPGNYYIDPKTSKVQAIDNDCSFGVNAVPKDVDVRLQKPLGFVVPNNGSLMLRMPNVVTKEIKENINNLYSNQQQLKETLRQYISNAEIEATIERLQKLVDHINSKDFLVVDNAEALLSSDAMKAQDSNNSYYFRERDRYRTTSWNDLRIYKAI